MKGLLCVVGNTEIKNRKCLEGIVQEFFCALKTGEHGKDSSPMQDSSIDIIFP